MIRAAAYAAANTTVDPDGPVATDAASNASVTIWVAARIR